MEENKEEEEKCWICKRGFIDALEEFNKRVLSNKFVDKSIKAKYKKGKKEFFPSSMDQFVDILLADVEGNKYGLDGNVVGNIFVYLCPVCSGLLESLSQDIDMEDMVTKKDLEDVSIYIKR